MGSLMVLIMNNTSYLQCLDGLAFSSCDFLCQLMFTRVSTHVEIGMHVKPWSCTQPQPYPTWCSGEDVRLVRRRWTDAQRELYNPAKKDYNCSKIPDIYDMANYDLVHNHHMAGVLPIEQLQHVYGLARDLARVVIPSEYGVNPTMKLKIGKQICGRLLGEDNCWWLRGRHVHMYTVADTVTYAVERSVLAFVYFYSVLLVCPVAPLPGSVAQ